MDRRSTTGFCVLAGGNLVTWRSKKYPIISKSTVESKYRALALPTCEFFWVISILRDFGVACSMPSPLFHDNIAAQFIANNLVFHELMKHIEVDCLLEML